MRLIRLLMLALCLGSGMAFAEGSRAAQSWDGVAPPVFRHLTPADGLPYPVALALAQDRHGFIWVATPGGAARWDGYRMTVFRHDDNDPNSLPENIVTSALADGQGQVWFGTVSGIVVRYDETIRGFVSYPNPGGGFERPNGMSGDGAGGIWLAGRQGLARLDVAAKVWRHETGLPAGEVGSVLIDRSGAVWAGTVNGLMRQRGARRLFEPVALPAQADGDMVSALFEDGESRVWFATRRGLVGRVESNGQAVLVSALPQSGYRVTAMIQPRPGVLWIADYGGGIRELRQDTGEVSQISHDPTIGTSLGDNSVTDMLVDRAGLVWVSSLRGIHRHIPNNRGVLTVVRGTPGGLPGKDVRSVLATGDGKVWLGFRAEGLALLDPAAGVVKTVAPGRGPGQLPGGVIQAIAETGDGRLWIGQTGGLFQVDAATGLTTPYAPLAGANIWALLQDKDALWAGGYMGLMRIPRDGGPAQTFHFDRDDPASLSGNSVHALHYDSAGRLWVGTQRGLNLLEDAGKGTFRRFLNDPDDPESLPSNTVNGIAEDRFGRIWLATSNGIGILDARRDGKPRFLRLGNASGLPNGTVLSVIDGGERGIIAGTGDGLALVDPQTLAVRTLGPAEGVQIQTFWTGASTRLSDGTVVMGGFGGMVALRPVPPPTWTYRAPVVVTDIRVGGRTANGKNEIVIRPEDGGFQVDFAALDFSAPERNRYAYRLIGNDGEWIAASAQNRTIGYTNLSPGLYRLELRGSNSTGAWTEPPSRLDVRVLPAWYQTWWFRLLAGVAVLGAVAGAAVARRAYYLRREQELTRQVAAKTSEAEAAKLRALAGEEEARRAKEDAEASAQMKSRFLAIIGHEIRTPLNGLLGMLQLLDPQRLDHGPRELLATAKKAGETLRHLVESILVYGRDGASEQQLSQDDVELHRLAEEAVDLIRTQALAKGLGLTLAVEPEGPVWVRCDHTKLSRILINLLGNAVKFTEQGGISVTVTFAPEECGGALVIEVADTGIGIAADLRDAIFGDFVQADDSITRKHGGVGLGLAISRRMAALMGGTLSVASEAGAGSSFRLALKVETGTAPAVSPSLPSGPSGFGLRVLVVDDDEINLAVARHLLVRLGHGPAQASSGEAAIEAVATGEFDVVLMDLRMPGMDGMDAARRIRQLEGGRGPHLRIIAMTADLTDDIRRQCRAAGMDGELSKPVRIEELGAALAATEASAIPPRPVDTDHLALQLDILGLDEVIRLARLFQRTSRGMVRAMEESAEAGDRPAVAAQAHRLRSAAGSLCLRDVTEMASIIEAGAAQASQAWLVEQVALLREARRTGLREITRIARRMAAGYAESTTIPNR
ncbi:hybrid sensor histidine kinase/response regulator [Magnetospirillum sp. XM-1]|uniref:hybrid sensor histidine kinase/response regulator n=1 Tax=Magnetospirillum sp. XM-1 TaxID=1663591 RepID=UPI000837E4A8|nr:hybrid sensor histidine kinase/response regulator [Magnetospirillum sp. XM-1]